VNAINSHPVLCGSVAGVASKLGVALHDAGYRELGLDFKYVAFGTDDIGAAVDGFRRLGFRGFGVSMPHKVNVVDLVDEVNEDVATIGACNTVVNDNGKLSAFNTDWRGALDALAEAGCTKPKKALVVGSGGVARAISYGLTTMACEVVISSRNEKLGQNTVAELNLHGWLPLVSQGDFEADLVINATPVSEVSGAPLRLELHPNAAALLDVVFSPKETELIAEARSKGLVVAPGWRMLLHQALHQFHLYTGKPAPMEAMSRVLEKAFD
jgi:shikimate dehydrogenase